MGLDGNLFFAYGPRHSNPRQPPMIKTSPRPAPQAAALLVLADGTVFRGRGIGAKGQSIGEVCFNTAITGYQEILTDPSYAGQIITFTFPHIGNVGTNPPTPKYHAVGENEHRRGRRVRWRRDVRHRYDTL